MVYNTIKEHQGITDIYSEPGIGTTFQVYLPCPESDVDEIRAATEREQILKGDETVMVVDDEKLLRDIAGQILKSCGYDVLYAENGRVAVEMLKSRLNRIDLVLLDMSMPLKSGKETFVAMKALQPDIRVLLTSGFKQDERVSEALSMGVKGFLQKPYTIRSLSRMVREILE